ncbi:AAA family ATPase [Caldibacillus debilis]|uniref:AAA family ATPase n=1 Tax=Caldibacillus debilis TaxID=301148 RepID=UPI002FD9EE42
MKLKNLRVLGFRGFNQLCEFSFTPGLNTLYGPNGVGKTSFAEALEWLFFGETSKLRFARSKTEFHNSLRNLHYEGVDAPFVEVEVILANNTQHNIKRELIGDNTSKLFIDGEPVNSLESLNIYNSNPVPIVAQHALKEFIHSEPVKRWETISKMLGMEAVSSFRSALTSAITQFKNSNEQVLEAVKELVSSLNDRPSLNSLSNLALAIEEFDSQKFEVELNKITVELLGGMPENPIVELQLEMEAILNKYTSFPQNYKEVAFFTQKNEVSPKEYLEKIVQAIELFTAVYPQYLTASEVKVVAERIELLKQGLALSSTTDPICPFCGEPTITEEKKSAIEQEIKRHETIHKLYSKSKEELENIVNGTQLLLGTIDSILPNFFQKESLNSLIDILPTEIKEKLSRLESSINDLRSKYYSLKSSLQSEIHTLERSFKEQILDKDLLTRIVGHFTKIDILIKQMDLFRENSLEIQNEIVPFLQRMTLENERVELLNALIRIWRNKLVIKEFFAIQDIIKRMNKLKKDTEEYEKELAAKRLAEKEEDILEWYGILNPNEEIRFARMGINPSGRRKIDLVAELYGKTANAVAMLSEAHINATGLSVYLGQIVSPYSPFKFIVLDDPVQSMDSNHTLRFVTDLISKLLEKDYQVIILSHLKNIIEDLKLYHGLTMEYHYEFITYHREGPYVLEKGPQLIEYLRKANSLKRGSSEDRTNALHILRKALERMCKMAYEKNTGQALPKKYQSMTARDLKALVKKIIPMEDLGKVNLILKYGDPASHDDQKIEPPTEGMVNAMIDQLRNLIVKYVDPDLKVK